MTSLNKESAQKELEKIYDSHFEWLKNGKILRDKFSRSLKENPKLNLLLNLAIFANIGIWLTFILLVYKSF